MAKPLPQYVATWQLQPLDGSSGMSSIQFELTLKRWIFNEPLKDSQNEVNQHYSKLVGVIILIEYKWLTLFNVHSNPATMNNINVNLV